MKKLLTIAAVSMIAGLTANAEAADRFEVGERVKAERFQIQIGGPRFFLTSFLQQPVPVEGFTPPPAPAHVIEPVPMSAAGAIGLFDCVKYTDVHEMSPCAVPKIIMVNDPCWKPCKCDCCCKCGPRPCVAIKICVPKCGCETIRCRRDGDRVRYDYGKYAVDVRVKDGYIEVDYQD